MDEHDEQSAQEQPAQEQPAYRQCPVCGANVPSQARFCGVCGTDTLADQSPPSASADEAPGSGRPTDSSVSAANHADGKLCDWCGAYSPPDAMRCVACHAVFPTPEGDQALEYAAQQRIKSMEGDLQQRQQRSWWPFRSR